MLYIYKFTNKINGKIYIGQTNNIEQRKRAHKSESFNPKANGYIYPFHAAIRKYGWDNFDFEILEEVTDDFGRDYLNEREIYFIDFFNSTVNGHGYNLTTGGGGRSVPKKTFSECCACSKILTEEQIRDIQNMLLENYQYFEIQEKYPKLSDSFLQNINNGWNFRRNDLNYPLFNSSHSRKYSKRYKEKIIQELLSDKSLTEISKEYNISRSYLSQINKGDRWFDEKLTYPLKDRSKIRMVDRIKHEIIFSDFTLTDLAKKLNVGYSTVKKINGGINRKDSRLIYPLRKNKKENQKIWNTLF